MGIAISLKNKSIVGLVMLYLLTLFSCTSVDNQNTGKLSTSVPVSVPAQGKVVESEQLLSPIVIPARNPVVTKIGSLDKHQEIVNVFRAKKPEILNVRAPKVR